MEKQELRHFEVPFVLQIIILRGAQSEVYWVFQTHCLLDQELAILLLVATDFWVSALSFFSVPERWENLLPNLPPLAFACGRLIRCLA